MLNFKLFQNTYNKQSYDFLKNFCKNSTKIFGRKLKLFKKNLKLAKRYIK